jgi:uncharacterized protein (TIGR02265 family)
MRATAEGASRPGAKFVVFRHTVDAFVRGVVRGQQLDTVEFCDEAARLGLDCARPSELPADAWFALIELSARHLSGGGTREERLERVGRHFVRAFADGVVGSGLVMVLRMLGPRRAMLRATENFTLGDDFTLMTVRELGEGRYELKHSPNGGQPWFMLGLLREGAVMLKLVRADLTWTWTPGSNVTVFHALWA